MKNLTPLFALLFTSLQLAAQTAIDSNITYIRNQFKKVSTMTASIKPDTVDMENISAEGAELLVYKNKGNLIKLLLTAYGETGKSVTEYYFDNREMVFAYVITHQYNRPMYLTKEKAKETGDTEWFDQKKTKLSENRYYFKDEKLIRWIGPDKKTVPVSAENYDEAEIQIHEEVYMLVENLVANTGKRRK